MDMILSPSSLPSAKPPCFAKVGCRQSQQNIGQIQSHQLCQLFRGHSPRSCSLCRTLPGSSAAACTSSCNRASTEGRLSLFSKDAEYSLNAELNASASGALKRPDTGAAPQNCLFGWHSRCRTFGIAFQTTDAGLADLHAGHAPVLPQKGADTLLTLGCFGLVQPKRRLYRRRTVRADSLVVEIIMLNDFCSISSCTAITSRVAG